MSFNSDGTAYACDADTVASVGIEYTFPPEVNLMSAGEAAPALLLLLLNVGLSNGIAYSTDLADAAPAPAVRARADAGVACVHTSLDTM